MKGALILIAALFMAGCAGGEVADEDADPSKLSAELEARATEIEKRADEAVAQVEREAAAELAAVTADSENGDNEPVENDN